MTAELKELIKAKLPLTHFVSLSFLGLVLVSLSYVFFIPFIYWIMYGEGDTAARIGELPFNVFIQEWGAHIIALLLCGMGFFRELRFLRLELAKSYLLVGVMLLLTYPFRQEIGDFIFKIFQ